MITFNELRYSEDLKHLIIDVFIDSDPLYKNFTIESIVIDNLDTYNPNGPSNENIFHQEFILDDTTNVYTDKCEKVLTEDLCDCLIADNLTLKRVRILLEIGTDIVVDTSKDILFVYAIFSDKNSELYIDKSYIVLPLFNLKDIYKSMMCHVKELVNTCSISDNFINDVLKVEALETCIKTENYLTLITLWKSFNICGSTCNNTSNTLKYNKCCG